MICFSRTADDRVFDTCLLNGLFFFLLFFFQEVLIFLRRNEFDLFILIRKVELTDESTYKNIDDIIEKARKLLVNS